MSQTSSPGRENKCTAVGFNVKLPLIRTTWVGSLTWRIVLIDTEGSSWLWVAPSGAAQIEKKKGTSEGSLVSLFAHLAFSHASEFICLVSLPLLIPSVTGEPAFPSLHHGIGLSRNFLSYRYQVRTPKEPHLLDWVTTLDCYLVRDSFLGLLQLLRHPTSRTEC